MRRLVVVSNRVVGNEGASGGLSVALTAALRGRPALWFGWSGRRSDRPGGQLNSDVLGDIELVTIDLEDLDIEEYYEGYANAGLWPLFHSRLDLVAHDRRWREGYLRVNRRFAFALAQLLRPDDCVWVHDYHLIPLGQELRRLGFTGLIGFFLHTPWPDPHLLSTLPDHRSLAAALFDYDLVGMQTEDCVAAFQAYVLREPNSWREGSLLSAFGRSVRVEAFPIGLDTPDFLQLAASPEAARCHDRLAAYRGERSLIIGVDRLDYSKGIGERLSGFEHFLKSNPTMAPQVLYLQIAPSSRAGVPAYQLQRETVLSLAGRINATWADIDHAPVLCLNRPFSRAELAGAYRAARVGLVTPLRDGMNLVAKEYVAAQDPGDPGVLVLSRFAGAARGMPSALVVNPYDKEEVADALAKALAMPLPERVSRWRALMDGVVNNDVSAWRDDFVSTLESARRPQFRRPPPPTGQTAAPIHALERRVGTNLARVLMPGPADDVAAGSAAGAHGVSSVAAGTLREARS